jgi:DNA repair photolyase
MEVIMEVKEFKSFYKTVGGGEGSKCHYPTRLDTYGCGCQHDCSYCYAKSLLSFRNLWDAKNPSVANIKKIENVIKKLPEGTILRLGGMTDCFQPYELEHRVTYKTIELLNKYNIGYLIVTKSHIVANDEYINLMRKDLAHIQITTTTLDDNLSLTYEKASVPSKRIAAIKKLQDAGFDVTISLSPCMPEYMDFNKLNTLGINKAIVEFLRVNTWIKKWFNIDYSKFTLKEGGYEHLPLEEKKNILSQIKIPNISVCEDVQEHYDYWKTHFNPNKEDCCNLRGKTVND